MRYTKPLYDREKIETVDIMTASNVQIEQDEESTTASASLENILDRLKALGN